MQKFKSPKVYSISLLSLLAVLTILSSWMSFPVASAHDDGIEFVVNSTMATDSVRQFSLTINDLVFNQMDNTFYASVPSSVGVNGNSITRVNPLTGEISAPVFVGSEPSRLGLSGDGQSLYVMLNGAFAVRRYNTATQTPGQQFSIGRDTYSGNYLISDLAVAPDNPNLIAIARQNSGTSSSGAGVAVFDNGVQRPQTGPAYTEGSDFLAFSANSSTLYGTGYYSALKTYTVDSNGVTVANTSSAIAGGKIKFDNGYLFSSSGQVADASTRTLLGTFANSATNAFVPDRSVGRAYYLVRDSSQTNTWILKAYDINTFVLIGTLTINNVSGDADALVRWGTNGLAFRTTGNQMFLVQTSLIPTNNPLPVPSATPTATPTPVITPIAVYTRQISVAANDVVYDAASQKIYASVNSSGANGNSIAAVNPQTGTIEGSVFVGSEPNHLALTNDGQELYVSLDGAGAVRKVNIPSLTAGARFSVGADGNYGPYSISDLAVAPDNPNLVAIPRQYIGISPSQAGVAVFDNGVQRPQIGPGTGAVVFGDNGSLLYGSGSSSLNVMSVSSSGVSAGASYSFTGYRVKYNNGLVYGSNGQVINPMNGAIAGTNQVLTNGAYSPFVVPDPANGRIFYLTNINSLWQIRAFDINTFVPLGSISVDNLSTTPGGFTRWGTNGLAIAAGNRLYLIQTSLVNPSQSVPTATPTPTPIVTPTPASATFLRRVEVPVNDLVYNESTRSIYASVPSTAGVGRGNTISQVNPTTGEISSSVFVGSEPSTLALGDDGQTIYVKLDGATAFRRFNAATQTAEQPFTVNNFSYVQDMAVLPGNPQSLVLTHRYDGVAIYDNGIRRPNMSNGGAYAINRVETSASASVLYGFCSESSGWDLVKFAVNAAGVSSVSRIGNLISGYSTDMKFSGGLLYATSGRVVDPETQTLIGTFQSGGSTMAVDAALHRAFFISNNILTAYDTDTFIKVGSVTLPVSFNGTPLSLVRWGTNGLAFRVVNSSNAPENQLYIIQSALVSSNGQIPTGLQLSQSGYFTSESNPTAAVNVMRTGDLSSTSSVSYSTSDGTATAGQDYTAVSGTLTFVPGEASKNILIPIINDNIYESPETFNVTLSNASAGSTVIFPGSSVVTISDNDSRPFISTNNVTVNEPPPNGTANAVFTVQLTNPTTQTVTVNFATVNGTATAGSDYVALNGTLTFNPLETVKNVSVVINGDGNLEPDETFSLTLSSPTNASISTGQVTAIIRNYNSVRRARFDFDGDNKTDVSIFRPGAGEWWYLKSSNGGNGVLQFGLSSDKLTPADFTGDGKTDIAFWRPSSGEWFILRSEDFTFFSFPFGAAGDIPAPADYDGDGKSDAAVYRPSNGTWYIQNSSGSGTSIVNFGIAEDKPVTADYDGDGKADITVFRPSDGSWWYLQSSNSQYRVFRFGLSTDKPVQGDYTGDGKADIAVFRPSTGEWFIQRSENNSFFSFPFGTSGDLPVPGDYDGDGKFDAAIFRPSTSTWYLNQTTAGVGIVTFGINGDNPVPAAFIP